MDSNDGTGDFIRELGRQLDDKADQICRLQATVSALQGEVSGCRHAAIRLAAMVADLLDGMIEADYDPRPWAWRGKNLAARAEYLRRLCGLDRRPDPTTPRPA